MFILRTVFVSSLRMVQPCVTDTPQTCSLDNTTRCGGSTHKPGAYGSQKLKVDHEREGQAAEKNTLIYLRK
jgi:hypothetical protein